MRHIFVSKSITIILQLVILFILLMSFPGLSIGAESEIRLRFYHELPGRAEDVFRGESKLFFKKYTGKSLDWSKLEKVKSVLDALLEGPTQVEIKSGYRSAIPKGTQILSLSMKENMVYIDFSKELVMDEFGDRQINEISDQLRVALLNIDGLSGVIFTVEGKSLEYYYPDTKQLVEKIKQEKFIIPFDKIVEHKAGGGTPVNQSKVVPKPTHGLRGKNIFISGGHGWYHTGSSWALQRPYLYTMNEDYSNAAFTNLFMIPMLENTGAFVLTPRERDTQIREIIVDNGDGISNPSNGTYTETGTWSNSNPQTGFASGFSPYVSSTNPFGIGSTRLANAAGAESARATWIPNIPKKDDYAVYVSYQRNSTTRIPDAHYYITHTGGTTEILLNQRNNGQTWVYLGTFHFDTGLNSNKGSVYLVNVSTTGGTTVSADAVRFGGGYGLITRGSSTSGHFKYTEGGKYFAHYSGAADSTVHQVAGLTTDYDWDIVTRGEFCNWYSGAPNGPNVNRNDPGQGIPIDAMVSFHSDAGTYPTSVHGQLTIWYQNDQFGSTSFPDGRSRFLSGSFATTVHNQILSDLQALYSSTWRNYAIWNSNYGEVRRPNVPSVLLEVFSHQAMNDMMYGLDPQFRHDLARATYKGILRFLCSLDSTTAVIMPLPPKDLSVTNQGNGNLRVSWQPTIDPLESTATTVGYVVYKSTDGKGFDNGTLVSSTTYTATGLTPNTIYYFKVTGYNTGGESFPTEVLGARTKVGSLPGILVVNGFERISRPEVNADTTGFPREDQGVWPKFNAPLIGEQTVFAPDGGSNNSKANTQELGNSFDYIIQHGKAIANAGEWFDSASKKSIQDGFISLTSYTIVDWIAGEEHLVTPPLMQPSWIGYPDQMSNKFKTFDSNLQSKISTYLSLGKHLFISGAYVSWDLDGASHATASDRNFLNNILKTDYLTNDAGGPGVGEEVIIDNTSTGFSITGNWQIGTGSGDKYGTDYRFALATLGSPDSTATWRPTLNQTNNYSVYVWYPQGANRSPDAPYTIHYNGGSTTILVNQQSNGGLWNLLGTFTFASGTTGYVQLTNSASPSVVMADAVRFLSSSGGENQVSGTGVGIFNGLTGVSFGDTSTSVYPVEQPDGVNGLSGAITNLTYLGTGISAGLEYSAGPSGKIVYLGFPFETITSETNRNTVMLRILNYFGAPLPVSDFYLY